VGSGKESTFLTMDTHYLKRKAGSIFILACIFIIAFSKMSHHDKGYLAGVISIGPICPVESVPPYPACLPTAETYKAYPVSVFSNDGKRKIVQLNPSLDGSYITNLSPGNYLVVLEKAQNNLGGSNLPVEISITSLEETFLNISIDTGIR